MQKSRPRNHSVESAKSFRLKESFVKAMSEIRSKYSSAKSSDVVAAVEPLNVNVSCEVPPPSALSAPFLLQATVDK